VRLPAPARSWRWAWLGSLALVAACGAVLVPLHGSTPPIEGTAHAAAPLRLPTAAVTPSADEDKLRGLVASADGPEGRLIAAYVALGAGDGRKAFELTQDLVREHPEFALAQLLYGDLLATRAGVPSSFGQDGQAAPSAADERRKALHDEALRRLAALRERPPAGKVPAEFALLPASIRHAVAVDASRSRLYLFTNGPQGLKFERDVYVSIGKQGMAKQVEGDKRTPLGVYWITASVPDTQLDERFGKAALRFNYPNAFDRLRGRTGFGLYLHGVPSNVMNHVPWATDGCVAMSNADVTQLQKILDLDSTPVVIARELNWVAPQDAQQSAAEFRPAYAAWDNARRSADVKDLEAWYDANVPAPRETLQDTRERDDVSFVAWYGDAAPMMIVTARRKAAPGEETYRQYWVQRNGQWRILFDGPVSVNERGATQIALAPEVAEPKPVRERKQVAAAKKSKKDEKSRAKERRTAERRHAGASRS
jgi:hypothetical protein